MDQIRPGAEGADVLLLGASRVAHGLVPSELEAVWGDDARCLNLGIDGCPVETMVVTLDRYLEHHPPPRAVLASVVPLFLGPRKPLAGGFEVRSLFRLSDVAALGRGAGFDAWLDWLEGRVPSRARLTYLRQGLQSGCFEYPATGEKEGLVYRTPQALWKGLEDGSGYVPYVSGTLHDRSKRESAYWSANFAVLPERVDQIRLLAGICEAHGVPLGLFATPQPLTLYNRQARRGYNRRVRLFWERITGGLDEVTWVGPFVRAAGDEQFADWWCHLTADGARTFSRKFALETEFFLVEH